MTSGKIQAMSDAKAEQRESGESEKERIDRELIELLNELRVALPGVQVLFAFLLTVPFAQGFTSTSAFQKDLFFAILSCTAISAALLIAPSAWHRRSSFPSRPVRRRRHLLPVMRSFEGCPRC